MTTKTNSVKGTDVKKSTIIDPIVQSYLNELIPGTIEHIPMKIDGGYSHITTVLKKIWRYASGKPESFDELNSKNIPCFQADWLHRQFASIKTKFLVEKIVVPQAKKLILEGNCLRKNPHCSNQCPTASPCICPNFQYDCEYE